MFEITDREISELNDEDLRTLVAKLCEAEVRELGESGAGVTAGGHQNAPDGGVDVRVSLAGRAKPGGYIPRADCIFQVKVPDMPAEAIVAEMRPGGALRAAIADLPPNGGAYIICSSKGSTADKSLRARRLAMRRALADCPHHEQIHTDFYDRTRLASWTNIYPPVANWVRGKVGRPIKGWRAFGNWSNPGEAADAEYLIDGQSRLLDGQGGDGDEFALEEGIDRLRAVLREPGKAVRLVGLSGMGKTRLVQALFDDRLGSAPLSQTLAVYADMSDEPEPSPRELARYLVSRATPAILVVDNCPPDLHRAVAAVCSEHGSQVSCLSVEYDVREDQPEGTDVFRLEPASDELIENLIQRRAPRIGQLSRRRIAEFSGGNARIALALADTVRRGESLANLNDDELFRRLFLQRKPEDEGLERSAEACALVYSFDGDTDGADGHLLVLAGIAGHSVETLRRHLAELKRRNLLQSRGRWQAVLPHALANRLAKRALENLHTAEVVRAMAASGSNHLLRSFTRRLSYLHDSPAAQLIATALLSAGGKLGAPLHMDQFERQLFANLAPVVPEAALGALERSLFQDGDQPPESLGYFDRHHWIDLFSALAYDAKLFERCLDGLVAIALREPDGRHQCPAKDAVESLFSPRFSGTHASLEQRVAAIERYSNDARPKARELAAGMLDAMLQTRHFKHRLIHEFGARPRDYGSYLATEADVVAWFSAGLALATHIGVSGTDISERVRRLVAANAAGICLQTTAWDALEQLCRAFCATGWPEGWIALSSKRHVKEKGSAEARERLEILKDLVRPRDLFAIALTYLTSKPHSDLDIAESEGSDEDPVGQHRRASSAAQRIAKDVLNTPEVLERVLAEAASTKANRSWDFGYGFAEGAADPEAFWRRISDALEALPENERNDTLPAGFITSLAKIKPLLVEQLLDEAVLHPVFGPLFPRLQVQVDLDAIAGDRLLQSLSAGKAPVYMYSYLMYGRCSADLPSDRLAQLVLALASSPDGTRVAVDVLGMRYHASRDEQGVPLDDVLLACGRDLLIKCFSDAGIVGDDHHLGELAKACLSGPNGEAATRTICRQFATVLGDFHSGARNYHDLATQLFALHPKVALDAFLDPGVEGVDVDDVLELMERYGMSLTQVPSDVLLDWARISPARRIPLLGSLVPFIKSGDEQAGMAWTPVALNLLALAPDKSAYLDAVGDRFRPHSWSGSMVDILSPRRELLVPLMQQDDPSIVAWAKAKDAELVELMAIYREREHEREETFE